MSTPITGSIVYIRETNRTAEYQSFQEKKDIGIGIALPIGKSTDGVFFKQSYTTLDAAKYNIKNLILTSRGERIMHPSLGGNLWNAIMEPIQDDGIENDMREMILENVRVWLPYIAINELNVKSNYDNNSIEIAMTLSLKNDPQTKDTMYLTISKGEI